MSQPADNRSRQRHTRRRSTALAPVRVLNGKYVIIEVLGQGRFERTYLAHPVGRPNEKVVVKEFMDPQAGAGREVFAPPRLVDSGVPLVLDGFDADGHYYAVMEFIPEAVALHELMRQRDHAPLPKREAIRIGLQVGRSLRAVHAQSIIHRDVKPSNILLGPDGRVHLVDFGIATVATSGQDRRRSRAGSPPYAAPELYHGVAEPKSDVYGLGVVMYEMLTGHTSEGLFTFVPVRRLNPEVSPQLARLVYRCIDVDRANRPTMDEVCDSLYAMLEQEER